MAKTALTNKDYCFSCEIIPGKPICFRCIQNRLTDILNAAAPLEFKKGVPDKPGLYWFKPTPYFAPEIIEKAESTGFWFLGNRDNPNVKDLKRRCPDALFAGPLTIPE